MLIAAKNKAHIQKIKAQLNKKFDMKNLEEAKEILGWTSLETKVQAKFGYPNRTMF